MEDICSKFHSTQWNALSSEERLAALQELANYSAKCNNSAEREVVLEKMNGATYGYFYDGKIYINEDLALSGKMVYQYEDNDGNTQTLSHDVEDANLQLMDTIFHEDYHSFQEQVMNGEIPEEVLKEMGITEETVKNWVANDVMYISPELESELYRIQELERTAFDKGNSQTKSIFEELNAKLGVDENYEAYLTNIEKESYAKSLENAKSTYQDENIAVTLQERMNEMVYGNEHENGNGME